MQFNFFKGFYILISGTAKCHWTESETREVGTGNDRRSETYTVSYDGKEVFINSKTYLFGFQGAEAIQIAAGSYKYNFAVDLPKLIPGSLSGEHGSIDYKIEAVLDIPWRFDKEVKKSFTVVRHDNLNDHADLKIPLKQEEVKTFCCFFCQSGPCIITTTIPFGGYAVGQGIPIRIEYANRSNTEIESTFVKLKRTYSYTSSTPHSKTKTDTTKLVEFTVGGARKGQTNIIDCIMNIPPTAVNSNSRYCRVFQVSYFLEIVGVVGGCHSNPKIILPIQIGSVGIGDFSPFNLNSTIYANAPGVYPINPISNVFPHQPMTSIAPSAPNLIDIGHNDLRKLLN